MSKTPACEPTILLLVEDNEADAAQIAHSLANAGDSQFRLERVSQLADALRRIQAEHFDVALIDLTLPDVDGVDTLRAVRLIAPNLPIVVLTGWNDEQLALTALKLGAQDYLFKAELNARLLVRSLRYAMERNRAENLESLNRKLLATESSLQEAKTQLESKNRHLARLYETAHEFVDNVSHEFRTPLTVIKEYVSLISDGLVGPVPDEQRRMLAVVEDRADDLNTMVDDMLDVSRLEAGMLGTWRKNSRIEEIIDHVRPNLEKKAAVKGVRLEIEYIDSCHEIYCDAEKVGRVIINLTINAIKFSRQPGYVRLFVENHPTEREILIRVADNGPGIDDDCLALIFQRFKQIGQQCRCGGKGFGLGLSIARELVDLNFGQIMVDTKVGKGSIFSFTVPWADPMEVTRRYLTRLRATGQEAARMTLMTACIAETERSAVAEDTDAFLNYALRRNDLLFRSSPAHWLVVTPSSGYELELFRDRVVEARRTANRNRPQGPLPEIELVTVGTWAIGAGDDPSPGDELLSHLESLLPSSEVAHV